MTATVAVQWETREAPLMPVAVAVRGEAARRMAGRLLDDVRFNTLEGVAAGDILVLMGPAERSGSEEVGPTLPWVDGCMYLGRDPRGPSLLLPTHSQPTVPVELLERAILQRFPGLDRPLAVLLLPELTLSTDGSPATSSRNDTAAPSDSGGAQPTRQGPVIVSLASARTVDRGTLQNWLAAR